MDEKWLPVRTQPFSSFYSVSSFGRVKRNRGLSGKEVMMKPQPHNKGYLQVRLSADGSGKTFVVHRLVAEAFLGSRPDNKEIDHINKDRTDNRIDNLRYVTLIENRVRGTEVGSAKLTEEDVLFLRREGQELIDRFGISPETLAAILRRRTWGWLEA